MIKLNRIFLLVLCSVILLMVSSGIASAMTAELYNDTIDRGDGYQINNYVIDVSDVYEDGDVAVFTIYNNGESKLYVDGKLQNDNVKMVNVGDSFTFDFEDGEVQIDILNVYDTGIFPKAKVAITLINYDVSSLFYNQHVAGGSSKVTYSGTPILEITTSVDVDTMMIDDFVKVTVNAENTGDDKAVNVRFIPATLEGFSLDEIVFEHSSTNSIEVDELYPVYIHRYQATKEGSFTLKPTTATFYNAAGQEFEASSTTPTLTVTAPEVQEVPKKNAVLELSTKVDSMTVERNGRITATIILKNTGDAPASAVWIDMVIPQDLEYVSGDNAIEIIGGVPKIYMGIFGVQQEKEFTYTVKASELGTYTLTTKLSYEYDNGVDAESQKNSTEYITENFYVQKGKYDELLEQPIYFYVLPIIAIIVIGAWILHRHKQYKF